MIIRRSRKLLLNPVAYESIEIFAEIEFDPEVDVPEGEGPEAVWADQYLTDLMEPEIEAAAEVTTNRKSVIHDYRYTETDTPETEDRK